MKTRGAGWAVSRLQCPRLGSVRPAAAPAALRLLLLSLLLDSVWSQCVWTETCSCLRLIKRYGETTREAQSLFSFGPEEEGGAGRGDGSGGSPAQQQGAADSHSSPHIRLVSGIIDWGFASNTFIYRIIINNDNNWTRIISSFRLNT